MSNKSAENPEGILNKEVLKSFMSIQGPENDVRRLYSFTLHNVLTVLVEMGSWQREDSRQLVQAQSFRLLLHPIL